MSKKEVTFVEGDDLQVESTPMTAKLSCKYWNVPFVNEVEEFNETMGKPNNYTPTIPDKKDWMFVYDFIQEELAEYKEACEKGDIVEKSHFLKIKSSKTKDNILHNYVFNFDNNNFAIVLGKGSIFNHQINPNIKYQYSEDKKYMIYTARRDIEKDEELFISYGPNWFKNRNLPYSDLK